MKRIVAIVKPFRAQAVLEALAEFSLEAVTVRECKGYGRQKDRLPQYIGSEYNPVYLPKIEIAALVADELQQQVLDCIVRVARTGRIGDGKILAYDVLAEFDF